MKILLKRLANEEKELRRLGYTFTVEDLHEGERGKKLKISTVVGEEEVEVVKRYRIKIRARGYEKRNGRIIPRNEHETYIYVLRSYPLPVSSSKLGAPLRFTWITPIFHPNISNGIEAGGKGIVCWYILQEWLTIINLLSVVKGLERLVENPNPDDALNLPETREAAIWYKRRM